jgi:hypothetical protein
MIDCFPCSMTNACMWVDEGINYSWWNMCKCITLQSHIFIFVHSSMARKRNDLTIQQKFEILENLKSRPSVKTTTTKFNIDPSTGSKIKSKEVTILRRYQLGNTTSAAKRQRWCRPGSTSVVQVNETEQCHWFDRSGLT